MRSSPIQVGSGFYRTLALGNNSTMAIDPYGTLSAWGENLYGQIGTNSITNFSWTQLRNGDAHSLALRSDGTLYAWGFNGQGQLGIGDTIARQSPTQVSGSWASVSAGSSHTLGIKSDNTLWGWGTNGSGSVGDGTIISRSSPVQINASAWTSVSAGLNFSTAIKTADKSLWTWGLNTSYQLGNRSLTPRSSPVQVGTSSWLQVSAGASHVLAIDTNNLLYGWGNNASGQVTLLTPISWVQVFATKMLQANSVFAIRQDGSLWAWGGNLQGNLGLGDTVARSSPVQVGANSWTFVSSSAGDLGAPGSFNTVHSIRSDGTLWGWGNNTNGKIGDGTNTTRSSPVQIGTSSWSFVYSDNYVAVGITTDGKLFTWGYNANYELGDPALASTVTRNSPVQVSVGFSWTAIAGGYTSISAIRSDGTLWGWGVQPYGQIGDGSGNNRSSPVQVSVGGSWTTVTGNQSGMAALRIDGSLWTWGWGTSGELGNGSTVSNNPTPTQRGTSSWVAVFASQNASGPFMHGITIDGRLFGWGDNFGGNLGDGTTTNRSSPVQVGSAISWTKIASGVAINNTYNIYTWGYNAYGQQGQGDTTNRSTLTVMGGITETTINAPKLIGSSSWSIVSAGYTHSAAITSDNRLFTWGDNTVGQLGTTMSFTALGGSVINNSIIRSDGTIWVWGYGNQGEMGNSTTTSRSSPGQIGTNANWSKVSKAALGVYAIDTLGKLYSWGDNTRGYLGLNDTISRSSPVQIGTSSWSMVSTLGDTSGNTQTVFAIRSDGALFAWGDNTFSQIGDGVNSSNKSSPVQVGTLSWSTVSAGLQFAMGITNDGKLYGWGNNNVGQLGTATTFTWSKIVSSGTHALAIRSDNKLFAWGLNTSGQLGIGDVTSRSSPVFVASGSYTQISAGLSNSYAIKSDGSLWSWGDDANGQLGQGIAVTTHRSSPVQIGTSSWSTVSASTSLNYVMATTSTNNLFAWGLNSIGQLGVGDFITRSSPVQVSGGGSWTAISAGGGHSLGIKTDYKLYTWGLGTTGQTAQAGTTFSWTQVTTGNTFSLAIRSDGLLFAWGLNNEGETGDGSTVSKSSPVQIGTSSWSQIAAGAAHVLAVRVDGTLWSWGLNNAGQLGQNDTIWRSSPVQVGSLTNWSKVAAGQSQSFAINTGFSLFAWGLNTNGVLGVGDGVSRSSPTLVATPVVSWSQVAAGASFTGGIDVLGRLYTWGFNTQGQLGGAGAGATTGSIISRSSPSQVGASSWSFVAAGFNAMAGITSAGNLFTWGNNSLGELGDNNLVAVVRSSPVQVGASTWSSITASSMNTAGGGQMLAITTANVLWGWGQNVWGSLGDGTTVAKSSMVAVTGGGTYVRAYAGPASLAITTTTFSLQGWGNNTTYGAVGDNTLIPRSAPVQIGTSIPTILSAPAIIGNSSWTSVSAGGSHSAAIRTDGGLFTWGLNGNGQLGLSDTVNRSSPVQVGTSSWTAVSAGGAHTLASRYGDNQLFTWGFNTQGQLGSGVTAARSSPVQVNSYSATTATALTFNGTTQYLSGGSNLPMITTGPFTIEAWVNWNGTGTSPAVCANENWSGGNNAGFYLFLNSTGTISLGAHAGVFNTQPIVYTSTNTVPATTWTHIAMTRDGSDVVRTFINGVVDPTATTITQSLNLQSGTTPVFYIGALLRDGGIQQAFPGSISNLRIVPRNAVYTTTFTPPTSALTATQSAGTNIAAISGIPSNGYSVWFNGSNMYLTIPYNAVFDIPSSTAFTFECWVYTASTNVFVMAGRNWSYGGTGPTWAFSLNGGNTPIWNIAGTGSATYVLAVSTLSGTLGQWNHYAFTRDAANLVNIWVNGVSGVSRTDSQAMTNASGAVYIGVSTNLASAYANGFMSNMRMVKGQALYTNTFTPSTSPLTTTSQSATAANVALLTCQSTTIIDNSTNIFTITNVNAAVVSLAYSPFGTQATILAAQGAAVTSDNSINAYTFTNVATVTQSTTATPFIGPLTGSANAGASNGMAISSGGLLYAWGLGTSGQVGNGAAVNRSAPVQVGSTNSTIEYSPIQVGSSSWSQVSAGASHVVAIKLDNTVYAWGLNTSGQLGDVSVVSRSSPVQVGTVSSSLTNANAYSLKFNGSPQNLIIANNFLNALSGTYTIEAWCYFTVIPTGNTYQTAYHLISSYIAGTNWHSWGIGIATGNFAAVLLDRTGSTFQTISTSITFSLNSWVHIAFVNDTNNLVTMYINGVVGGTLVTSGTWSTNGSSAAIGSYNASGTGYFNGFMSNLRITNTMVYTGVFIPSTIPLTAISGTVLLTAQNTSIVDNSTNALTLTNNNSVSYSLNTPFPSAVATGALFATQVSAGFSHTTAIDIAGKLYTWGAGSIGQLGINSITPRSAPIQIGFDKTWKSVSAGWDTNLAIDFTEALFTWGKNDFGQLGDNTIINRSSPVQITSMSLANLSSPIQVGSSNYSFVCTGNNTTAALSSTNKLFVWGLGTTGQLGTGVTFSRSSPVQISTNSYNLVNAGGTHTTFVPNYSPQLILGTGLNTSGQLGLFDIISRSSPTQIGASTTKFNSPVTVSTGNYSSYYVSSPTQVGSSSWTSVSAGGTHTLGVRYDNTLWAWGYNANGQLGGSSTINRSSPVQIGTSSWSQVSAGDNHNIIAKSDGTINTFGLNSFGQLGDGT